MAMHEAGSFYWHDYETWGADPRRDRAAQFAGVRTDAAFNEIGEPLVVYCRPADDILPQPEACLVTGLTPQHCREQGLPEAEFFGLIHEQLAQPGTCALGYNSLRFDDEFTRFGLYRNFFDPYAREWQNGNSRWDLIDVARLTRALRPEGVEWPVREDGATSFRLEELTAANGIAHEGAHDALADVRATIALGRLLRNAQPRLFAYLFEHRDKAHLRRVLDPARGLPVLHVSARYPARLGCLAAVLPVARHPTNPNSVIVYDLRIDPTPLISLDADAVRERLYTPVAELPEGAERIPLKEVRVNRGPVVVPMNTLTPEAREQWNLDAGREQRHLEALRGRADLAEKVAEVFGQSPFPPCDDPDQDLYGGFLGDADRRLCDRVRASSPEALAQGGFDFEDPRLAELLFRYRARNWPETLGADERARWGRFRRRRLCDPDGGGSITLDRYRRRLAGLAVDATLDERARVVVDALLDWPAELGL
jgi:exodeoxyribonuclease-1